MVQGKHSRKSSFVDGRRQRFDSSATSKTKVWRTAEEGREKKQRAMDNMTITTAAEQPKSTGLKAFNQAITNPKTQEYLGQVLGEKKGLFVNNITALVANNAMLQECNPMSVMYAAIKATALDLPLDPSLGFAYVIPYNNKKRVKDEHGNDRWVSVMEAQFQIGYKGFLQLAMRSGMIKTIAVRDVRLGEIVREDFVSAEIEFKKLDDVCREQVQIVGYVGYIELINGFRKMEYWTLDRLKQHGFKYSKSYANERTRNGSLWATDFNSMAQKTVIKMLLSKYAPMSVTMQYSSQMADAIKYDQATISAEGQLTYVDNDGSEEAEAEVIAESNDLIRQALDKAKV